MNSHTQCRLRRIRLQILLAVGLLALSGCSKLGDTYGHSSGSVGTKSLNGFGVLRGGYENADFATRDVRRLSERIKKTDVIVWTPQVLGPIGTKVTNWFDQWLRRDGHTLVYIVPDSGSVAEYWTEAGQAAPPQQRLEYRRRAARSLNERMQWTLNRGTVSSNGWFFLKPASQLSSPAKLKSEGWNISDAKLASELESDPLLTEFKLEPYIIATQATPANAGAAAAPVSPATYLGPTGPSSKFTNANSTKPTSTQVELRPLLRAESGDCLMAEVTSKKWGKSRVIVVAGGSLLTNFGLTRETNARLADEIIRRCGISAGPEPLAGFLTSSYGSVAVSEKSDGPIGKSGMELLTVWPISLVTIHGAFLGFIVCMMLLPIFGRPKRVARGSQTDFGDHLDAVAALMSKSQGETYARRRISEYMRRMNGETGGPWVVDDPVIKSQSDIVPPIASTSRR